MSGMFHTIGQILSSVALYYALCLIAVYAVLAFFSGLEMKRYILRNKGVKHRDILSSPHAPSVSILVPFNNQAAIVLEKVRLLLSLHYNDFELIIINDGSTDNSLKKLINSFNLQRADVLLNERVATAAVKGIYRSSDPAFSRLTVVDKLNGGRCDALNAGVNVSGNELLLCLNINCMLEPDALLRMVKPFMESRIQVIAAGAVVRSINASDIVRGQAVAFSTPRGLQAKFQVLRHLRSSLLRHMALSRFNSLLHVSRAVAMFHKPTLISCGGFMPECVENNAELVIRMKRYMIDNLLPHRIILIPDKICWLIPPGNPAAAAVQYQNSIRGTADGLRSHARALFNPTYKWLALSSASMFFSKLIAPVIEFTLCVSLLGLAAFGYIGWQPVLIVASMVYLFCVSMSLLAIAYEELTFRYTLNFSLSKLFAASILEPLFYYPVSLMWFFGSRKGNVAQPAATSLHVSMVTAEPQVPIAVAPVKNLNADKFANCEIRNLTIRNRQVLDE
ncbi:MAG: glycosyltransferase [Sphingobacteriaceae bacterium]|jgi:cellulose synthase/poly-beta-1,6-N-acetylglucosamine synthase-like glycosyltransferase|nr:glycosyltransferase [Sphingobacteriaceae bacterium]